MRAAIHEAEALMYRGADSCSHKAHGASSCTDVDAADAAFAKVAADAQSAAALGAYALLMRGRIAEQIRDDTAAAMPLFAQAFALSPLPSVLGTTARDGSDWEPEEPAEAGLYAAELCSAALSTSRTVHRTPNEDSVGDSIRFASLYWLVDSLFVQRGAWATDHSGGGASSTAPRLRRALARLLRVLIRPALVEAVLDRGDQMQRLGLRKFIIRADIRHMRNRLLELENFPAMSSIQPEYRGCRRGRGRMRSSTRSTSPRPQGRSSWAFLTHAAQAARQNGAKS